MSALVRLGALVASTLLFVLSFARSADATELSDYHVEITPDARLETAHYVLTFGYLDKLDDGFKFVGTECPVNVRARDLLGNELTSSVEYESYSGEYRVRFQVPKPGGPADELWPRRSTAIVEFDQAIDFTYAWTGRTMRVDWAKNFRIGVAAMSVTVKSDAFKAGYGWTCAAGTCGRTEGGPFAVEIPVRGGPGFGDVALGIIAIAAAGGAVVLLARRREAHVIATRGVYPTTETVAYPEPSQAGYRVPPPLPEPQLSEPVLSDADRDILFFRKVGAGLTIGFVVLFVSFIASSRLPLSVLTSIALAATLPFLAMFILSDKGGGAALAPPIAAAFAFGIVGFGAAAVTAGITAFISLFVWLGATGRLNAPAGSTGSSYSSDSFSSFSSCGGGGGGCGGGGGGGGCGG